MWNDINVICEPRDGSRDGTKNGKKDVCVLIVWQRWILLFITALD